MNLTVIICKHSVFSKHSSTVKEDLPFQRKHNGSSREILL